MRLLLDTHIFLWVATDSDKLGPEARRLLESADAVYVSAASIWEIAIKARLGKIDAEPDCFADAIEACGFLELPVFARHGVKVSNLPLIHRDPFDRLLVAQAMVEPMRLVTADAHLKAYSELVVTV
jgi:PIN domain nuclease of toxin-antitoxin system